jgi:hypothetical protein
MDRTCETCGADVDQVFCGACGEKVLTRHDHSLGEIASESLEHLLHLDSRLFRTLGTLVGRPGLLVVEYWKGRRLPYMKPIQLLILLNVAYFLCTFAAARSGFNASVMVPSLYDMTTQRAFSPWAARLIQAKLAAGPVTLPVFQAAFDHHLEQAAKSFVLLLVPILALLLKAGFFVLRRPMLYHVVAATHLVSFYVLLGSAYLLVGAGLRSLGVPVTPSTLSLLPLVLLSVHLFLAFRRAYGLGLLATTAATLLMLVVGMRVVTTAYDFILFVIVYRMA